MSNIRNIQEISEVSNLIGASEKDAQILEMAIDFNKHLKLDSEALIFALLKSGMKPNISSIFTLSEKVIRSKVSMAIGQKIIPDSIDIDFELYLLNSKISKYIIDEFSYLFSGINDSQIRELGDSEKNAIIRNLVEYSYQDKDLDTSFYNLLFEGDNPLVRTDLRDKIKTYFDYRDICNGNILFINEFVESETLQPIDKLLKLSKQQLVTMITADMVEIEEIPSKYRKNSEDTKQEMLASLILDNIENKYATRSLFLKMANYTDEDIKTFGDLNIFETTRSKLVREETDNTTHLNSETLLLDTKITVTEKGKTFDRSFDIRKDVVRDYIEKLGVDNTFVKDTLNAENGFSADHFIRVLTSIQRLYFLVKENKFETIMALIRADYKSAYDIVKSGRFYFESNLQQYIKEASTISYIYNAAEVKVNKALALLNKYSQSSNSLSPTVVRPKTASGEEGSGISVLKLPELETLFGNQDVTDTPHGDSVFSPAAYLVDLFSLLKQIDTGNGESLFEALKDRRPDIENIPLDCKNAVTLIPYIDLVIEILEKRLVDNHNKAEELDNIIIEEDTFGWNTTTTEDELKAEPQYCAYPIYDYVLSNFTWKQPPFDLKNEELKLYLKALGIDRVKWAGILDKNDTDFNKGYDVLGFNSIDTGLFKVISLENISSEPQIEKLLEPVTISETDTTENDPVTQYRINVRDLLSETGLYLDEFNSLLGSFFINPNFEYEGKLVRHQIHYANRIELANAYVEFPTHVHAKVFVYSMYQFRRLLLATSWNIPTLDSVLLEINEPVKINWGFGEGSFESYVNLISEEHINKVGRIKKIQIDNNLTNNQVTALFGKVSNFKYETDKSYFNWLFIDNDYSDKYKVAFTTLLEGDVNSLDFVGDKVVFDDGSLHPFIAYICSVLQIDKQEIKELDLLLNENKINTKVIVNLVRYRYLSEVFDISINDLIAFLKIKEVETIDLATLESIFEDLHIIAGSFNFVKLSEAKEIQIEDSCLYAKIAEKLISIVNSKDIIPESLSEDELTIRIIEEISQLTKTSIDTAKLIFDHVCGEVSIFELVKISSKSFISQNQAEIINSIIKNSLEQRYQIEINNVEDPDSIYNLTVTELDGVKNSVVDEIVNEFFISNDTFNSKLQELKDKGTISDEQIIALANLFKNYQITIDTSKEDSSSILKAEIERKTTLESSVINEIIEAQYESDLKEYISLKLPDANNLINSSLAVKIGLVDKFSRVLMLFNFSDKQLYDFINLESNIIINFDNLDSVGLEHIKSMLLILKASVFLKEPSKPFTMYKEALSDEKENLGKLFRWSESFESSIEDLIQPTEPLKKIQWLIELGKLYDSSIDLNNVLDCFEWKTVLVEGKTVSGINESTIHTFKELAKSTLGRSQYLESVAALRDSLRVKQRDALVSYMLSIEPNLQDSNDLFSFLLIDTEMSPAVSTSRIVQSTLSIQLLIQRIQFNLEKEISLKKTDENKWKWMSLYRVWEANRKIFLYPENWLEPELRDDKSVFFKELEKDLTSSEITTDSVENAYYEYLAKVEKVANIEYCQMYEEELNDYSIMHVIGRSPGIIHEYYYRKFINETYWTAWEPLGLEINSEHIAPVVINDRLMVFWLEYFRGAIEPEKSDFKNLNQNETISSSPKVLSIQICWSEYKSGAWSQKHMHSNRVEIEQDKDGKLIDKKSIRLIINPGDENYLYLLYSFEKLYNEDADSFQELFSFNRPSGYKFIVEAFNNVNLTLVNSNSSLFDHIKLPEGTSNYYQKVMDAGQALNMRIATKSKITSMKEFFKSSDGGVKVIYPHQFHNFNTQTPLIAENKGKSFIIVPIIQPDNGNEATKKIRDFALNLEGDFGGSYYQQTLLLPTEIPYEDSDKYVINDQKVYKIINSQEELVGIEVEKDKTQISVHLGYHPFVGLMRRNIERYGIDGLLDPAGLKISNKEKLELEPRQANNKEIDNFSFNDELVLNADKVVEKFEFNTKSAFGIYNWEIFYHIPYMIANHFYTEGNYDEAIKWMHYIFDPRESEGTNSGSGQNEFLGRFWKFKPFAENNDKSGIEDILFDANMDTEASIEDNELDNSIEIWSNDPFKPHNVARMRIGAYMKATVMRYLDILVARGDQSFRVGTMESINEALQYYISAAQIIGNKPEVIETSILNPVAFKDFDSDEFSNAIEFMEEPIIKTVNEAFIEKYVESNEVAISSKPYSKDRNMKNMVQDLYTKVQNIHSELQSSEKVYKLYFGIPKNNKLFRYWELVGDRLFKIRNSLNIDGIKRTLSLFAPPIDPGMLASAAAAGLDIKALVNGQAGSATQYRFNVVLGQAIQLCTELKSLSSQLLSAYEKHDVEKISNLRANHEILLSEKVTRIREKGIEDAVIQIEQLDKQKEVIDFRKKFYENRKRMIKKEEQQLGFMEASLLLDVSSHYLTTLAANLRLIPDIYSGLNGYAGSPSFQLKSGGELIASVPESYARSFNILRTISSQKSSKSGILAGYDRRNEEWRFQADMASLDYAPLEKQKLSAQIRKLMAEYELENHEQQLKQSRDTYEVLKTKYTNEELYMWMRKEIAELHRKTYDMAYSLAKQAEKAYDFELNPGGFSKFISASHFDTKYEGIFAGEKLFQELKEMEMEYYKNNKRKYELTKSISLAILDPCQIMLLRDTGSCEINLPEVLFDMDHPGHCNRRVKSVSLTIPCVSGPYTSVSAELTLVSNQFKTKQQTVIQGQPLITNMATSSAQNDTGMFQLNFNDERYLPFEGAGVESRWLLSLPNSVRQFDYNTINDVILTIQYTAENGGNRITVEEKLFDDLKNSDQSFALFVDVKIQYPEVFENLKAPEGNDDLPIKLSKNLLPAFLQSKNVEIAEVFRYDDNQETNINVDTRDFDKTEINLTKFGEQTPEHLILVIKLKVE